ncbi:CAF17-like 4Fe-4S cluster assembly/insertion protein YgfZ [Henriciella marina]|uniref:CAF17-like 4Fe-4S cluster assembly/insertion protein YgfZ n=1 Tax=Henriciella marina TaxID=453851 RepID=UPI00038063E0|nr:folate-binding protein YgfZ [Henriciella marina]
MDTKILSDRSVLVLDGPDTIALLERLVTNNTHDWPIGEARYGALLTPQGKVIADFIAHRTEGGALLDVATHAVGDLSKRLQMFRLRAKVEIGVDGKQAVAIGDEGAADPRAPELPKRSFVEDGSAPTISDEDWDAVRIPTGVAEWGRDFQGAEVFPWEINMDRQGGVDLKKGCFVGQEVVSRMHRRGKLRKRTIIVEGQNLQKSQSLEGETPVGEITSTAGNMALAIVRVDRLAKAGDALTIDGKPAKILGPDWLKEELAAVLTDNESE